MKFPIEYWYCKRCGTQNPLAYDHCWRCKFFPEKEKIEGNIMNEDEVVSLMKSSKSEQEWNNNCDAVKKACGGYPSFWYGTIVASGLAYTTQDTW